MRAAEEVADEARCSGGGESNRRRGRAAFHRYGCLRVRAPAGTRRAFPHGQLCSAGILHLPGHAGATECSQLMSDRTQSMRAASSCCVILFQMFVGASLAVLLPAVVQAADYPNKPIRVVVPFAAAGVTDIVARVVFDRVSARHRSDRRDRQSPRRRRHDRGRAGGERAARRLHADHGRSVGVAAGERDALSQPEIPPASGISRRSRSSARPAPCC